ncbi:hypothetical protein [Aliidiomarina quisquiliarum]|uniref:ParM/StbA family protein n=1 Tax=Aliidiomarina quisquiliarum TaxID=2938947 RepID=UPI00208F2971|nr:hypothetical protein [Aliidiomarina quisquiliarum]MCO4319916.1 hypothetical protein [Aliidiomarina quisquiliarum]
MGSIVRAVEVGFGNTAVITGVRDDGSPRVLCFPSTVAKVDRNKSDLSAGLSSRNTKRVVVNNSEYEVGPEAHLATSSTSVSNRNAEYIYSTDYQALLQGAMSYIDEDVIDLMVVGLPVNNWSKAEDLKKLVIGTHEIDGRKMTVKRCWCIPQPLGGLLYHGARLTKDEFNELSQSNVVSVDPGMLTFDWLVSRGLKLNNARSGAVDLGMSNVLKRLSEEVEAVFRIGRIPVELIDSAFWRHKNKLKLAGRTYPFPVCKKDDTEAGIEFDFSPIIERETESAVTEMVNHVGSGADVELFILMGGAAEVFKGAIQRAYPNHKILLLENHLTAVCEGMFFGGIQYLKQVLAAEAKVST